MLILFRCASEDSWGSRGLQVGLASPRCGASGLWGFVASGIEVDSWVYTGVDRVQLPRLVSLRGFGASGLHGFGIKVDSCVYTGNGVGDIGYRIF